MDKSRGQANGLRDQADALTVLNTCEMADMGNSGGTGTTCGQMLEVQDTTELGQMATNWSDALSGHRDVPDIHNSMDMTADTTKNQYTSKYTTNAKLIYQCRKM